MSEGAFMKANRIKEVSKMIDVPEGTLRQWEKDFEGVLKIPRDEHRNRYYTEFEIDALKHIKAMRDKNISKDMIRELLAKNKETQSEEGVDNSPAPMPSLPSYRQQEVMEILQNIQNLPEQMRKLLLGNMSELKEEVKKEVREEFKGELREELLKDIRKELASGSEQNKTLLESGQSQTSEQFEALTSMIEKLQQEVELNNEKFEETKKVDSISMDESPVLTEEQPEKKGFFRRLLGS